MICSCSHTTGCECHLKPGFVFEQIQPGSVVRFEYPQFDPITHDLTHYENREVSVETFRECKNGSRLLTGLRLKNGITDYRSYHIDLIQNLEIVSR